ncbi:NUMOD4 domain-containing protein [Nocardia sp. NPDC058640]|uniref:NUMOD4 domain-containing protein n=1 Tax=Nocardia sp. NPDC058640 TaxID=3346571 RepID=UPI00366609B8
MQEEIWMRIPGFDDRYEASSDGRIRSNWSNKQRVLGTRTTDAGYVTVSLRCGGKAFTRTVNRLVALAFYGEPADPSYHACHNDGDKSNNQVSNIRWDTPSGNAADKLVHGTNWQLNKTHCAQGHEYTPENTRMMKSGGRRCITCKRADSNQRYRDQCGDSFGTHKGKKLTAETIAAMRDLRAQGLIYREIAERYGVSAPTARLAILGESHRTA